MNTFEAIEARRAVKQFDPSHKMSQEEIDKLLYLTTLAPTAFNIQHWRLVLVEDPELRRNIRAAAWDQSQVTDASMLLIFCADLSAWTRTPERYWAHAPQEVQNILVPAIKNYYQGREDFQRDEAMRSCGLAAQTLMLAAKAMGYDSCPMDGFDFDQVGKLINLPEDHIISMFVAVGKGTKQPWPRGGKLSMDEVVVRDKF